MRKQKWALENRLAFDEARMRILQEGIEKLKSRMGEMGK